MCWQFSKPDLRDCRCQTGLNESLHIANYGCCSRLTLLGSCTFRCLSWYKTTLRNCLCTFRSMIIGSIFLCSFLNYIYLCVDTLFYLLTEMWLWTGNRSLKLTDGCFFPQVRLVPENSPRRVHEERLEEWTVWLWGIQESRHPTRLFNFH